jgi:hypothetical protein
MAQNKARIIDILNGAKHQSTTSYRSMMSKLVEEDVMITNMPPIRINANRTMTKYRHKQEEI